MLGTGWPPDRDHYTETPVLLLAGERDRVVPVSAIAEIAEQYPSADLHVLSGVEHLQGLKTSPDEYRRTVLEFLDKALA
jgi:alpha-beta hydrolase superfamily lysophospholipase